MNGNVFSSPPMEITYQISNTIITRLVTETNQENQITIVYAATQNGQILKLVQRKKGEKYRLLTTWILDENQNDQLAIRDMVYASVNIVFFFLIDFHMLILG